MTPPLYPLTARRFFFEQCGVGLGKVALTSLLGADLCQRAAAEERTDPMAPRMPHFRAKAKQVIFLFMAGGPSHLDLFDYKPTLRKYDGQPVPPEIIAGKDLPFIERDAALMSSPLKFARYGDSGAELSELLPHLAGIADDLTIVRSLHTNAFNHAPAQIFMQTGYLQLGKPSLGAWVTYGLGSENQDLPAFVVMNSAGGISGGAACFGSGFLPSDYQGVSLHSRGNPILYTQNPPGYDMKLQRRSIDLVNRFNRRQLERFNDPEIASRINAYELAFRLQVSAPDLVNLDQENQSTFEMYGIDSEKPSFARNCLLARRLVERGVRFICLFHKGWDHHADVVGGLRGICPAVDRPSAALVRDLKQRGLLDETLVVWGGEFGRTPMVENNPALNRKLGRDHHPDAFSMWLAGGGIAPGQTIGQTDEMGYYTVEDPVHVHDLHATMLHLLGMDHKRLTFRYQGRDFRLTDVSGNVVEKLLI